MTERLHKYLAQRGYGSRRAIESWIAEGRITVDGTVAQAGIQVEGTEKIVLDGQLLRPRLSTPVDEVIIYHKPEGEVTTRNDPEGRKSAFANLPRLKAGRWVSVGRLDINTSGLLLFTTNGQLANRLMHPSGEIEREYAVRVLGKITDETLQLLTTGVELEDGLARFDSIREAGGEGANHWYHVTLREGRKREVRRLWESQGVRVSRLTRVRYGPIALPRGLRAGKSRPLDKREMKALFEAVGMELAKPERPSREEPIKLPQKKSTRPAPKRPVSRRPKSGR